MKFCPNCGTQLSNLNPKFCPECGTPLQATPIPVAPQPSVLFSSPIDAGADEELETKPRVYDLGIQLEHTTKQIFEKMGYTVLSRQHVPTRTQATAEIDLLLTRGQRRKAVECKNYSEDRAVGVSELRVFQNKLEDSGIASGVFVTSSVFSQDARKFAESTGMELWDGKQLREKFYAMAIGRVVNPTLVRDPVLPVRLDFTSASNLSLRNGHAIKLFDKVLFYHPYITIKYRLSIVRKDPTGKTHRIQDSGVCVIDALDADIVNKEVSAIVGLAGLLKSKEERLETKEDKLVTEDLMTISAQPETIVKSSDYDITVAEPAITEEEAIKITKNYVVQKNTTSIKYESKKGDDSLFATSPSMKVVPRLNEVEVRGEKLVYLPKWDLQFEAGQQSYEKRILASSAGIIEDELAKCGRCKLLKGQTTAICEQCGACLCDKHAIQEAGRWLCETHSVQGSTNKENTFSKFFRR